MTGKEVRELPPCGIAGQSHFESQGRALTIRTADFREFSAQLREILGALCNHAGAENDTWGD